MRENKEELHKETYGFTTHDKTKTVFLSKRHLKENAKKLLSIDDSMLYHVTYESIKKYIRDTIKFYIEKKGYKVVFEHNDKKILLLYNN